MSKAATLKDVLYALEYGGGRLCRWPTMRSGFKQAWSIEPGGLKVPSGIADQARAVSGVVRFESRPDGYDEYRWRAAA